MFKVLVVEDEPRHRRCLAGMIKELRPEYEIMEAKNGREALDITAAEPIKVVITDVKMPVMDGLEFIQSLGERSKEIKVIILSGYAYFEYAQTALRLGAFDFVLKPVNQAKVNEMLKKAEEKIREEICELQEKERMKNQLDNALPAYLERQLNKWIGGSLNKIESDELAGIFPFLGKGTVIVSEIGKYDQFVREFNVDEFNEMKVHIKHWIKGVLDPLGHTISFFQEGSPNILITVLNTSGDSEIGESALGQCLKKFIVEMHASYGLFVTIGYGGISDDIFRNVRECVSQAYTALNQKFFYGVMEVIAFSHAHPYREIAFFVKSAEEDELLEAVRHMDKVKAAERMAQILNNLKSEEPCAPEVVKDQAVQILQNLLNSLKNLIHDEVVRKLAGDAKRDLLGCETFRELSDGMLAVLDRILTGMEAHRGNKYARIIEKCKAYIEVHYTEDLSLEFLADMFKFNASYFSVFFRNNTGVNFTEYLLKVRMKKAVELLMSSSMKVYEVAERTGYHNEKYFNRVFKKEFGVSPDEYRRTRIGI